MVEKKKLQWMSHFARHEVSVALYVAPAFGLRTRDMEKVVMNTNTKVSFWITLHIGFAEDVIRKHCDERAVNPRSRASSIIS